MRRPIPISGGGSGCGDGPRDRRWPRWPTRCGGPSRRNRERRGPGPWNRILAQFAGRCHTRPVSCPSARRRPHGVLPATQNRFGGRRARLIPFPALAVVHDQGSAVSFPVSLHDAVAASPAGGTAPSSPPPPNGPWPTACLCPPTTSPCGRRPSTSSAAPAVWPGLGVPPPSPTSWPGSPSGAPWPAFSVPGRLAESLWHLYGFLTDTGRLHPASDALVELRAAVVVFGPLDRLRPVPSPPPQPTAASCYSGRDRPARPGPTVSRRDTRPPQRHGGRTGPIHAPHRPRAPSGPRRHGSPRRSGVPDGCAPL